MTHYLQAIVDKLSLLLSVHMYWHKNAEEDLVNLWMREKLVEVADKLEIWNRCNTMVKQASPYCQFANL